MHGCCVKIQLCQYTLLLNESVYIIKRTCKVNCCLQRNSNAMLVMKIDSCAVRVNRKTQEQ